MPRPRRQWRIEERCLLARQTPTEQRKLQRQLLEFTSSRVNQEHRKIVQPGKHASVRAEVECLEPFEELAIEHGVITDEAL